MIAILDTLITHIFLRGTFAGVTALIQHTLIAYIFLVTWQIFVGFKDLAGWIIGSLMLGLVFVGYSMYLGPLNLPTGLPYYMGYDELWYKAFPGASVATLLTTWVLEFFKRARRSQTFIAIIFAFISYPLYSQTGEQQALKTPEASAKAIPGIGEKKAGLKARASASDNANGSRSRSC